MSRAFLRARESGKNAEEANSDSLPQGENPLPLSHDACIPYYDRVPRYKII
jgi:hypothetical protein